MFCNQCEQTAKGSGCTVSGVCGKKPEVAHLQDMLVLALRKLARSALAARGKGVVRDDIDHFAAKALFATLTNVNFTPEVLGELIRQAVRHQLELCGLAGCTVKADEATVEVHLKELEAAECGTDHLHADENVRSAMQILLYGMKGVAAYTDHAALLGQRDQKVFDFFYEGLAAGFPGKNNEPDRERTLDEWLELILRCGTINLRAMELLETGHTQTFGHPTPTAVDLGHRKGKAILVSGHDMADLHALLKATEGTGVNIYTHGEMLPAHGYPKLREFSHLAGHFGTAWQNQHKEFPLFPGTILFTTNCIQSPGPCADKIFTSGMVGWPGVMHCENRDFSMVIERAMELPGFEDDAPGQKINAGFGRKALLDAAPTVLSAIKAGDIRHIFLVGGCDGAKPGRNYYTEFVEKTPADTLILTLACGKFRFFDKDLGKIGPFPRLLDVGQCNDAFAAVSVALALADALECTVNDLPLSLVLSWYEQKAVCILLTLLALGVKNIRLGPSLPAFVSPAILQVLVDKWGIAPITTPDEDLKALLK